MEKYHKVRQRVTLERVVEVCADCESAAIEDVEDYEIQNVGSFTSISGAGWSVYDTDTDIDE